MFRYFGSKARLAPTYQAPKYDVIVEPFAGAAGYSMYWLSRQSDLRAVLADVDPVVVDLWNRLLGMTPTEIWEYPPPTKGAITSDPIYLVGSVSSGSWGRYKARGDFQVTERQAAGFPQMRERMAQTLSRVRGRVTIDQRSYDTVPDIQATWFIDPPYQREGIYYNSGNQLDFKALGEWARSRQGQVIVCETVGADWMDFDPLTTNQTLVGEPSVEAVWYSHPEPNLLDLMT